MTGQEVLDLIMFRCGHNSSSALRAAAVLEAKLVQQNLEGGPNKPWFMLTTYEALDFVTSAVNEHVNGPSTFITFDEDVTGLYWYNASSTAPDKWIPIERKIYSTMKTLYADKARGVPQYFDYWDGRVYLRPFPDAVYNLRLAGYFQQTAIADTSAETTWTKWAADLLVAETLVMIATKHLKDLELEASARADAAIARDRMKRETRQRQNAGRNLTMGGAN